MQSYKFDEIIDKACQKKNLDKDMAKSISDFIFQETKEEMGRFSNLRIYLDGLLAFFYGKTRLIDLKRKLSERDGSIKKRVSFIEKKSQEEVENIESRIDNLIDTYEVYIKNKTDVKTAFRESKKLK